MEVGITSVGSVKALVQGMAPWGSRGWTEEVERVSPVRDRAWASFPPVAM